MKSSVRIFLVCTLATVAATAGLAAQQPLMPALNVADIDTTCKPCEDFYKFATGGWAKRTPIPPAFSNWSGFAELTDRNSGIVRSILEGAAADANTTKEPGRRKLGHFYATCMDTVAIEQRGYDPIRADLARIDKISSRGELIDALLRMHANGIGVGFGFGAGSDANDSRRVIFQVSQGGIGMPDRDYYVKTDSATLAIKAAYLNNVAKMLELVGVSATEAKAQSEQVLALETAFAGASLGRVQMRDPKNRYHMLSVASANELTPGFSWTAYLGAIGVKADSFNVAQPEFFRAMSRELSTRPLDDWKAYLRYRTVSSSAGQLSSAFVNQAFVYNSALTGAREQQPRWRRCLGASDGLLTDLLGKEYVKVAYTPEAKATMDAMISNLLAVYRVRLQSLPWMGEETRKQALKKLGTFGRKMGYPSTWRDYAAVDIKPTGWFENLRAAGLYATRTNLAGVGKPVDRSEWGMTPPTVNAYYSAANNEIVFPAGRLQPPFFHPSYDLGANYGGIGATIGHETSHGFDDQGRKFDADGNLRDWWSADDATRFGELAAALEKQYNDYVVLDGLHINGKQTMGENIADNAGVSIAYEALQLALKGQPRTLIDGFTPEQRFFLGWAQARRTIWRDQALRLAVQTDVHSPGEFRVNGPLSNMPEFAAAFGCKKGDKMVRENPVRIF